MIISTTADHLPRLENAYIWSSSRILYLPPLPLYKKLASNGFCCTVWSRRLSGRFPDDSPKIKALVGFIWVCEFVHAISIGHTIYTYTISNYGYPEHLAGASPKTILVAAFLTAVIATFGIQRGWMVAVSWSISTAADLTITAILVAFLRNQRLSVPKRDRVNDQFHIVKHLETCSIGLFCHDEGKLYFTVIWLAMWVIVARQSLQGDLRAMDQVTVTLSSLKLTPAVRFLTQRNKLSRALTPTYKPQKPPKRHRSHMMGLSPIVGRFQAVTTTRAKGR
ncbi:hypothetical protein DFH08DRAFT_820203 [Mycena albidolilacea]|uniref:Uncharacterized protein n=1 Tax=Mycena albidolilacea TaxID=1033008 RepID=A0AAD6ZCV4_9AGAR|nr:hypothetical protein DFH08DRAFT_820203 [Mycena albidolilacea]